MKIEDITLNFNGTGQFGSNNLVLDSATVNVNAGNLTDLAISTSLTNSTLNVLSNTSGKGKLGVTTLTNSTLNFSQASGNVTAGNIVISNSTISGTGKLIADSISVSDTANLNGQITAKTLSADSKNVSLGTGANVTISDTNALNYTNLQVASGATLNASKTTWKLDETKTNYITGGNYILDNITFDTNNGNSTNYITAQSVALKGNFGTDKTSNRKYFIGIDESGNTYSTAFSCSNFQVNEGGLVVIDGNSSLTSVSSMNIASTKASNLSNLKDGSATYIGKNAVIGATLSRINGGYIDGDISINKGYQSANNWNYTFAIGVVTQYGNVILGDNVKIDVLGATSAVGKNFTICGNITSNAASGAIKSDANAGFYIRTETNGAKRGTVLTLNSTDAFAVGGAFTQGASTFLLEAGSKASLIVNANNNLGVFAYESAASQLTLSIASGKVFKIGSFANVGGTELINLLLSGEIGVGQFLISNMAAEMGDYENQNVISFIDEEGNRRVLNDNLFIQETLAGSGIYSISTVIPEPAEWAAIFGVLTLFFVAIRRRK